MDRAEMPVAIILYMGYYTWALSSLKYSYVATCALWLDQNIRDIFYQVSQWNKSDNIPPLTTILLSRLFVPAILNFCVRLTNPTSLFPVTKTKGTNSSTGTTVSFSVNNDGINRCPATNP